MGAQARRPQRAPLRHSDSFLDDLGKESPFLAQIAEEARRQAVAEENGQVYDEHDGMARMFRTQRQAFSFTANSHPERE